MPRAQGFLSRCQQLHPDESGAPKTTEATYEQMKGCVRSMCDSAFANRDGFATLLRSCHWYVDWYELADNPNLSYRSVTCPRAIDERAGTGPFAG